MKGGEWPKLSGHTLMSLTTIAWVIWLQTSDLNAVSVLRNRLDYLCYDLRLNWVLPKAMQQPVDHRVVIIDVDDKSLQQLGRWPWPRASIQQLVAQLQHYGVTVIGFDVVFSEPQTNAIDLVSQKLPDQLAKQLVPWREAFDEDRALAEQLQQSDVVAGVFFHLDDSIHTGQLPAAPPLLDSQQLRRTVVPEVHGFTGNVNIISNAAIATGFTSVFPDLDGSIRRVPLLLKYQQQLYLSFALELARTYRLSEQPVLQTVELGDITVLEGLWIDQLWIATDAQGQVLIPYRGKAFTYPYLSAVDVIKGKIDPAQLEGSIALVGTSAIGMTDLKATPVGAAYPGVESQATVTDAILRGFFPSNPDYLQGAVIFSLTLVGLILTVVLPYLGPWLLLLVGAITLSGATTVNFWVWYQQGIDLPLATMLMLIALLFVIHLISGFQQELNQRQRIKNMFNQYVSPEYIDTLLDQSKHADWEGETKEITVLFSDIRGFTQISEDLSATELKRLLNHFFTPMTAIIFENKGTIDKYVGDMVMAFWGAPLDDQNQRQHAVITAVQMLKKIDRLKQEFRLRNWPEISIGIGINTGSMNVGDMGSEYRRAYTVLGDEVNLGSRLESITKFYGVTCLVSENTMRGVNDIAFREVDYIQVKGKAKAIRVYQPLGYQSELNLKQQETLAIYQQARQLFLQRQWLDAQALYRLLQETDPDYSGLYNVFIQRIQYFRQYPPSPDWQGIYRHTQK